MEMTQELAAKFVGGQAEIQNQNEGYIYRGEIKSATVEDDNFAMEFAWLAKGKESPPVPTGWVNSDTLNYAVGLKMCGVSNIGSSGGDTGGGDRICLNASITGEMVILYPPDGSKLDPSKVEGLELAAA